MIVSVAYIPTSTARPAGGRNPAAGTPPPGTRRRPAQPIFSTDPLSADRVMASNVATLARMSAAVTG
jgi:hypothetical protein